MSAKYMLVHERGHLGPKTIDEWATPNGDEPLLLWMAPNANARRYRVTLPGTTPGRPSR